MKKQLLLGAALIGVMFTSQAQLSENFDGTTFPPAGWSLESLNENTWVRTQGTQAITGAGSAGVFYDGDAPTTDQEEYLISPEFTVGSANTKLYFNVALSYTWAITNAKYDVIVAVSDDGGASWSDIWDETELGVFTNGSINAVEIPLADYAGQAIMLRFGYIGNDGDFVFIDDISVAACATITNLTLEAMTSTGPSFTWEGTAPEYTIEYGETGFTQGEGETVTTDTEAYAFTTFEEGVAYDFYFRSNCSENEVSAWDGPYSVGVPLTTAASLPYSYDFEAFNNATAGWATLNGATGGVWGIYNGPAEFQYDGNFAGAIGGAAVTNSWLFSRGLNLVGGTEITVSYWLRKADLGDGESINNNMTVTIGTDKTAAAQTTIIATHEGIEETEYTEQAFTYTVPASGVYYLGFHATSGVQTAATQGGILLDDVTVSGVAGVNESLASQLSVFPNPATNVINVINNNNILVEGINIVDLNGRTVKSAKFDGVTEAQVNISDLANGVYMMTVSSDKGTMTQKIVKN